MKKSEEFFSENYFAARDRFQSLAKTAGGRLHSIVLDAVGPNSEKLTVDIAWFGASNPRSVVLHSSGLHGVEGFAGSAIQLHMLQELPNLPQNGALIVVHTLNPFGMAHLRRVNENNVDLNRNFVTIKDSRKAARLDEALYAYCYFKDFLNPAGPPTPDFFKLKAARLIWKYGMPMLRQALVAGQYWFPKGLFYGGKLNREANITESEREQGPREYQTFLMQRLAGAERVIAIDVHTGLGKYACDALLAETQCGRLRTIFGERVTPLNPNNSVAYNAWGTVGRMIPRILPNADVLCITQEFGTYSATRVLHALREENRWHHHGAGTMDHSTKRILKDTFCPEDASWRDAILRRGRDLVNQGVSQLK